MHGLFQGTLFSTYVLNNENYNSVSYPCVSIDYAQDDRTSKTSASKLCTRNSNFVPLDNNENKQTNKNKAKLKFYERIKVFLSKKCENTSSSSYHPIVTGRFMDV